MTDITTKKPLRVAESTAGPYLTLPLSQVDEVKRLLDRRGVTYYWVGENAYSWNGGPFTITVNFGHSGDAALVQSILDEAC